jgi:uncharacterized membrane-anchored protein
MIKLLRRLRPSSPAAPGISGPARVDGRTKRLAGRLLPGDIAVIDHADVDRVAAESLVAAQVAAVVDAAPASSSRFPNMGPQILVEAGVPLLDNAGPGVMRLREGTHLQIDLATGVITADGHRVGQGEVQSESKVQANMAKARRGLSDQMAAFAANTMDFLERESDEFLEPRELPQITTVMKDRPALIVVRGYHYREDLAVLKPYVAEAKPVLIGVDGGADALIEAGLKPDMVVGDMDSVSDKALASGAELVVHAYRDGRAPGAKRLENMGLTYVSMPAAGTSEDVAMLIADNKEADLIVAVGTHLNLVEFLDKGREGMASTFLTRLRVGGKLVDAKGVSRLYRRGVSNGQLAALLGAGAVAMLAALLATPAGQTLIAVAGAGLDDVWAWIKAVVT